MSWPDVRIARGVTASHMIREAIEAYIGDGDDDATELARQRVALRHDPRAARWQDIRGRAPRSGSGSRR